MVTALIALAVMVLLGAAAMSQANTALRISGEAVRSEQALYMANAGVEMILAKAENGGFMEVDTPYNYALELQPGITGHYEAVVTVPRPGIIQIRSTGTVEQGGAATATRVVQAEIPFDRGSGGGGLPPDRLVQGNGPVALNNSADVCGDLYAKGNVTLGNNVIVWSKTKEQDVNSPCTSILGTGKVVASGTLTKGNNTVIQGGWCDETHFGAPYPCESKPEVTTLTAPDWADLKARANRWYVRESDSDFCADKPAGSCQVLPGKNPLLTMTGSRSYSREIVFVDGDFELPQQKKQQQGNQSLTIAGTVTFAVTGKVTLGGDLWCEAGASCDVLFIAQENIELGNNKKTIYATLFSEATLVGNQTTIHGNLVAAQYSLENGITLYPRAANPGGEPPPGGGTASPVYFSDWDQ